MAKHLKISSDQHIRIRKVSTLSTIQAISEQRKGEGAKINTIINEALEIGLPCVLNSTNPETVTAEIEKATQRIIMNQNRQTQRLQNSLQKLSIFTAINEAMVGTLIHELEELLNHNGIKIPEEMLNDFMQRIPERFEKEKERFIENLSKQTKSDTGE